MSSEHQDDRVRLHAVIHGLVQGVNFRANTQREAAQLGLTGWVTNRFDGTVEVVAEGPRSQVQALERFLHRGPRLAEVERVERHYDRATGEFGGFNIRY
ncbi:acylphosphatase [Aggregatilinea lenta]|uniref:acylphosphatase n=1 Tax=Aggregatilinea lenta TaxID=913108 RepID=UPI000E5C02E9|nr:acylphosphatase [Aggregatilinea lenta]